MYTENVMNKIASYENQKRRKNSWTANVCLVFNEQRTSFIRLYIIYIEVQSNILVVCRIPNSGNIRAFVARINTLVNGICRNLAVYVQCSVFVFVFVFMFISQAIEPFAILHVRCFKQFYFYMLGNEEKTIGSRRNHYFILTSSQMLVLSRRLCLQRV